MTTQVNAIKILVHTETEMTLLSIGITVIVFEDTPSTNESVIASQLTLIMSIEFVIFGNLLTHSVFCG